MKKLLVLLFFLAGTALFAQEYEEVTIQDIQFLADTTLQNQGDVASPLDGDTVKVRGTVLVAPIVDPQGDRRPIIAAGGRWVTYIEDENGQVWGGLNVLQDDTTGDNQLTGFQNVDTADVIEFYGVVTEYYTTTEMLILLDPLTTVTVVDQLDERPAPIELEISDFMQDGEKVIESEKYEGMRIVIREGVTSDRSASSGTFKITDADGNFIWMYDQSGYFTNRGHRLTGLTDYEAPLDGSTVVKLEGIVTTRDDTYYIVPVYPGDLETEFEAPNVGSLERTVDFAGLNEEVEVSTKIFDANGTVESAQLFYSFDGAAYDSIAMDQDATNDSLWTGSIPGFSSAGDVRYFVKALDNDNNASTNPQDTSSARYFYLVLDGDPTIRDVQYSPYGSGYSSVNGYEVTVQGIVTADSGDYNGSIVYIQDGNEPWSGMRLIGSEALNTAKGDLVEVTGVVREDYSVTTMGSLEAGVSVNVISSGNEVPAPVVISTGTIDEKANANVDAEQYENMLVRFEDVLVAAANADGSSNFGEMLIDDNTGAVRVELEEGVHKYHNGSVEDETKTVEILTGDTFDAVQGVLYFSFSNYKLLPRTDSDFEGYVTDLKEQTDMIPDVFSVSQNYPNPFNPATTINYNLPEASNVQIVVYDMLGRKVAELVNDYKNAGSYKVNFNAASLASGIYIYRVDAGKFSDAKKMILMK